MLPWILNTPGASISKPHKNTMVMRRSPGTEFNLVQASNFPFHMYFPVREPEPLKPNLINGSVYIKHTFSNGFPVLESAANLVSSTAIPEAVIGHLELLVGSVKVVGQGVRFNPPRGLHDACWAFEIPYRKILQKSNIDPDSHMITGVPSLQRYLQECWVGISPAPSDGFLFSVGRPEPKGREGDPRGSLSYAHLGSYPGL